MSLIVWCPLISDLHNQGMSSTNLSGGGSIVSSGGKLASSCFHQTTAGTYVTISQLVDKVTFSISCWIKINSSETYTAWADCWSVEANADGSSNPMRVERMNSSYPLTLYCLVSKNATNPYRDIADSGALTDNSWNHHILTFDGSTFKYYVNGTLRGSVAKSSVASSYKLTGRVRLGDGNSATYLQDFRVYDKALSETEIKELSKGLVAHYTLGTPSLMSSGNLITELVGGSNCTISGSSVSVSGTNSDTYFYIKTSKAMTSGKLYRLSCRGSGFPSNAIYYFPLAAQNNTDPGYIHIKNGYCVLIFVANSKCANAGTNVLMDDMGGSVRGAGTISELCLEEFNAVADISGYSRNLTITGNVNSADSVRYDKALQGNGSLTTSQLTFNNPFTISYWVYLPATGTTGSGNEISIGPFNLYKDHDGVDKHTFSVSKSDNSTTYLTLGVNMTAKWYHIVIVSNGNEVKIYNNGVASTHSISTKNGLTTFNLLQNNNLKLSDVRVYATALSADDVTALYKLGQV